MDERFHKYKRSFSLTGKSKRLEPKQKAPFGFKRGLRKKMKGYLPKAAFKLVSNAARNSSVYK